MNLSHARLARSAICDVIAAPLTAKLSAAHLLQRRNAKTLGSRRYGLALCVY
jgi:hypothetical protein